MSQLAVEFGVQSLYQDITKGARTMKTMEFKVWMRSVDRMSRGQREKLRERLEGKISNQSNR